MRLKTQDYERCTTKIIFLSFFLPIPFFIFFLERLWHFKKQYKRDFPKSN